MGRANDREELGLKRGLRNPKEGTTVQAAVMRQIDSDYSFLHRPLPLMISGVGRSERAESCKGKRRGRSV